MTLIVRMIFFIQFQQLFPSTISSILSDGSQGDFLLLIYRTPTNDSALADIFNTSWASANRKEFEIEPFGLPFDRFSSLSEAQQLLLFPFLRSDHANFWVADIPAIFLTDSGNMKTADYLKFTYNVRILKYDTVKTLEI